MKFIALITAAAGLAYAQEYIRCATEDPSDEQVSMLNEAAANASESRVEGEFRVAALRNIDTYVHVVTTPAKSARYSQAQVNQQIDAMNTAYAPINIAFNLVSAELTVNAVWATSASGSTAELAMKQALHRGSYAALNLYFISDLGDGLLGYCYFPEAAPTTQSLILDGCVNLADSLPSGAATNYNLGATAIHEVGHWFGLYHVFQGQSCSGSGDYVSDTPLQRTATSGCPSSKDSCPSASGADSVHNWMDYSWDICMYQFSGGQITRAGAVYDQLRAGK